MKGYHLLLNCYNCNVAKIDDIDYILETMNELIKTIDMKPLCEPLISREAPGEPKGVTIVAPITTSHLSLHSFTEDKMFFMDVFSCKMFNPREVEKFIKEKFDVKKSKMRFEVR